MQWERELSFEHVRGAAELARQAVSADADMSGNWLVLARALAKLSQFNEAMDCLRDGLARHPDCAELHLRLAAMLFDHDRFDEALPHAERAVGLATHDMRAQRLHFELLALSGLQGRLDPGPLAGLSWHSAHLLNLTARLNGPAKTLELCEAILAARPGHTYATYVKATSLAKLGRAEAARDLISLDRLIDVYDLPTPADYQDAASFREALAREIGDNPTLEGDSRSKAAHNALQTRALRQPGAHAVEALLGQLRHEIDRYEDRLADAGEPLALYRPKRARLEAWGMICGPESRQDSHAHPNGWITGVFYVAASRTAGANCYSGPLALGSVGGGQPPWGVREIEPAPGRLVLFPSYVPHEILPSGVAGERISVAFDIVDADREAA